MATVQTELSKDGGSLVKAAEQFWKQQYESRWLGHSLQVYCDTLMCSFSQLSARKH